MIRYNAPMSDDKESEISPVELERIQTAVNTFRKDLNELWALFPEGSASAITFRPVEDGE